MLPSTVCPSDETLQLLASGQLPGSERDLLERHVFTCPSCSSALIRLHPGCELSSLLLERRDTRESPPPGSLAIPEENSTESDDEQTQGSLLTPDTPHSEPEPRRLGHFRILKLLGAGGMGQVFLAHDESLQRTVALKTMRPHLAADPNARERFLREARANAAVHHDNVVAIFQIGEASAGDGTGTVPYVAMQLLEGEALDIRLSRSRILPVPQTLRIGREIAQGLAAAHARGLIHRDIKPSNIWLEAPTGRVKILDFGLARAAEDQMHLTQPGMIIGTPAFMSPEQARNEKIDARSDLFSLGALLYRMVTGVPPFQGTNTLAILSALTLEAPRPVHELHPSLPTELASLIHQLLAKKPEERPASAAEVVDRIRTIEQSLNPSAVPERATSTTPPPQVEDDATTPIEQMTETPVTGSPRSRLRRLPTLIGGAALIVLAGVVAYLATVPGNPLEESRPPDNGPPGTPPRPAPPQPQPITGRPSPLDALRRENIPADELALVEKGDRAKAPWEVVGIFGSTLFNSPESHALAYSPDGKTLASTGMNQNPYVRFWDSATGRLRGKVTFPLVDSFHAVAYRPDGQEVAASDRRNRIWLFHPETGASRKMLTEAPPPEWTTVLIYSPDGKKLYTGGGFLKAWNLETGQVIWSVPTSPLKSKNMLLTPNGKVLLIPAANQGEDLVLLDVETGREIRRITGYPGNVTSLAVFADGKHLAVGRMPVNEVQILDYDSGKEVQKLPSGTPIHTLAVSPDGKFLAGLSMVSTYIWNLKTGKQLRDLKFHRGSTYQLVFRPDGNQLALAFGSLATWDTTTWQGNWPGESHRGRVLAVDVSREGQWVVSAGADNTVRVWDSATGRQQRFLQMRTVCGAVAVRPDGQRVFANEILGIRAWDWADDGQPFTISGKISSWAPLALSPDGSHLAAVDSNGLMLLNASTGDRLYSGPPPQGSYRNVVWHPEGRWVAAISTNRNLDIELLEVPALRRVPVKFASPVSFCSGAAFHPDGQHLVLFFDSRKPAVVQLNDGAEVTNRLGPLPESASEPAFSPDGKILAFIRSKSEGIVLLQDVADGKILQTINPADNTRILSLKWAPDGRHLITGNDNGTIHVLRRADVPSP